MKQGLIGLALSFVVPVCLAANPASTAYVDRQFAGIQAQIDVIAAAHKVGDCYGGGVIYWLNPQANPPAGQQGLIVALGDASNSAEFYNNCSPGNDCPTASSIGTLYFTGSTNTSNVITAATGASIMAPAASAAKAYVTTDTCTTCTPWYLPAQDELAQLYFTQHNDELPTPGCSYIPLQASAPYWSSTQIDNNVAWFVDFSSGAVSSGFPLSSPLRVRAVRAF